jgi:hypothetical protein
LTVEEDSGAVAVRNALADQVCARYSALGEFRAGILTGSTAAGLADQASDLDVVLFYDSVPELDSIDRSRVSLGGERLLFSSGEEGGLVQSFLLDGIKTDVAHIALSKWRADAADVLERFNADSPMQKALSGLHDSIVLRGGHVIETLRSESVYPDGLARSVVMQNLRFLPPWALQGQAAARGDTIYFYELLAGEIGRLIRVLCGVNRIFHWGETKHTDHLLGKMRIAPPDCRATLPTLYSLPMSQAAVVLDELIHALFDIVEREMPEVDTSAPRKRYNTPGNCMA